MVISNGDISLGDIVFSDGDFNQSLGDIFLMLRNRISLFDFCITVSKPYHQVIFYHHSVITI